MVHLLYKVLNLEHFPKYIGNNLHILKCGAREGWGILFGPIMPIKKYCKESKWAG